MAKAQLVCHSFLPHAEDTHADNVAFRDVLSSNVLGTQKQNDLVVINLGCPGADHAVFAPGFLKADGIHSIVKCVQGHGRSAPFFLASDFTRQEIGENKGNWYATSSQVHCSKGRMCRSGYHQEETG